MSKSSPAVRDSTTHATNLSAKKFTFSASARSWGWWLIAAITCPCHLPLLLIISSGTAFGLFIDQYLVLIAAPVVALFYIAIKRAMEPVECDKISSK
jgi:mercuric ion transport protein